nr:class I SAM-dependent RNA methyltransferase [Pseudomonadota bacterium]
VLPPGPAFPLAFYVQAGAQATLVVKARGLASLTWAEDLRRSLPATGLEGLWLNLHPAAGRRLFARHGWQLLWGRPWSVDSSGLCYGPAAFQQLIPALYRQALDEAQAFLAPMAGDSLVDLYCGSGASLRRWTACHARTVGVELGGEAVACARRNAPAALVLRGKCGQRLPQLRAWISNAGRDERLLYANPPRTGIEPQVLEWITGDCRPQRLAYLSCSAGTLGRDLRRLDAAGYRLAGITPYDFFPQTHHVETLATLERMD